MKKIDLFTSFIKNPKETSYEGKDPDEDVILLIRRSLLTTIGWLLVSLIFLLIPIVLIPVVSKIQYNGSDIFNDFFLFCLTLFWYVFVFYFAFESFLQWYFEVLLITNKKIVDIDKNCTNISETPLNNIQDVTSKMNSVWGQVFNIGSIHVQTAAESQEFEFTFVDNPSAVRDTVSDLILKRKEHDGTLKH
jgi:hypothetical protein